MTRLVLALVVLASLGAPAHANPARARHLLDQARALLDAGDDARALAKLEEAIAQNVDLLPAYAEAIPLWVSAGQLGVLRRRLERVTARHPEFAQAWYALGYAYRKAGRADLAVLAYQSYVSLRPGEAAPLFGLAMAYKAVGDSDRAEDAFRRYVARERDSMRAEFVDQARRELWQLMWRRYLARWTTSIHSGQ